MALKFPGTRITSDGTPHTAELREGGCWFVSWLPGRNLTHSQAISAMMIAQACAGGVEPGSVLWVHVGGWAAELGLEREAAVRLASEPPHWEA